MDPQLTNRTLNKTTLNIVKFEKIQRIFDAFFSTQEIHIVLDVILHISTNKFVKKTVKYKNTVILSILRISCFF